MIGLIIFREINFMAKKTFNFILHIFFGNLNLKFWKFKFETIFKRLKVDRQLTKTLKKD